MKPVILVLLLVTAIGWPPAVAAQEATPPPSSTHTRARNGAETTLEVENARLVVPAGAVSPGEVIAFGTGGVPAMDGALLHTGAIVSAAGGLHAPVVLLIVPTPADRAAFGSETPALRATIDGSSNSCASAGQWIACPVPQVGAYVLGVTGEPPSTDPIVRAALAGIPVATDQGGSTLVVRILVIAAAALGGGAIAWWLGRPRTKDREPAERA